MHRWSSAVILVACFAALAACGDSLPRDPLDGGATPDAPAADAPAADAPPPDAAPDAQPPDATADAAPPDSSPPGPVTLRFVAANLTSGPSQRYEDAGIHILQALHPDIALVQEMNSGDNSPTAIRSFVDTVFGSEFTYYREEIRGIPNGIVSRYPIVASGSWDQPQITDRELAWARIDVPGDVDLWAVSVHLKATAGSRGRRVAEAQALVAAVQAEVPPGDYLVIGGDFNTYSRTPGPSPGEPCLAELAAIVDVAGPWPADAAGDDDTNGPRSTPYDWILFDADLGAHAVPARVGAAVYDHGLVFDSRVFTPLGDVVPVRFEDSAAANMQHMAVVRDVRLP